MIKAFFRAATCVVAVAMLLCFPAKAGHRFVNHFRAPQVRQSIGRHTFFAQPEITGSEVVANRDVVPTVLIPATTTDFSKPLEAVTIVSETPRARFLLRLKLGPSSSSESDPLS
jgi:hypothetical protein